jgi:tetratricopeptide (TPR) repeat protein
MVQTSSEKLSEVTSHKECQSVSGVGELDGPRSPQETMEGVDIAVHGSVPSDHCTWPFSWATVDVPGSPGLSRLFSALEIECSQPVPPLSLDEPDAEDSQHISGAEMIDLWNEQNRTIAYEFHSQHPPRQASLTYALSKKPSVAFPWRNPGLDFCGWTSSPLDEIYVFPTPPSQPSHKPLDAVAPSFLRLDIDAAEFRSKLSKLNRLLPDGHPSIIMTKLELANIYLVQGQYNKAGKLFRCAAIAAQKTWGSTNVATFSAWLDVVNCLTFQGLDLEAHALITKLRATILQYVDPEHGIATRATQLLAVACDNLGNSETAEDLLRQVLQIYLNRLGSRSCQTWMSMKSFGWILSRLRRYSEAEKLARIALQLQSEIVGVSEAGICEAVDCLSMLCNAQYKYEDSAALCRSQLERLRASLGPEHPSIIRIRGRFALSLARQGHYTESEAIFQSLLTQESESMEWHLVPPVQHYLRPANRNLRPANQRPNMSWRFSSYLPIGWQEG